MSDDPIEENNEKYLDDTIAFQAQAFAMLEEYGPDIVSRLLRDAFKNAGHDENRVVDPDGSSYGGGLFKPLRTLIADFPENRKVEVALGTCDEKTYWGIVLQNGDRGLKFMLSSGSMDALVVSKLMLEADVQPANAVRMDTTFAPEYEGTWVQVPNDEKFTEE